MKHLITDQQFSALINIDMTRFRTIVDCLHIRVYGITGILMYPDKFSRKPCWGWKVDVIESVSQEIMEYLHCK